MTSNSPTIFVSSTVYDFQDLRSALKYQLEQYGFSVQMSEHADFDKPIDQNSYEACFAAIRASHAFVLLVGGRRGGWHDEPQRVSITQAEYRIAHEESEKRHLPIIVCVRKSVWDQVGYVKESMRAPAPPFIAPCKFINDPMHLIGFLGELGRVEEMRAASQFGHALPHANWIHTFSSFSELVDILRIALRIRRGVAAELLLAQVSDELLSYSSLFVTKNADGTITSYFDSVPGLLTSLKVTADDLMANPPARVTLTERHFVLLILLNLTSTIRRQNPLTALEAATTSPLLAVHDPTTQTLSEGKLQTALRRTLTAMRAAEASQITTAKHREALYQEAQGTSSDSGRTLTAGSVVIVVSHFLAMARALAEAENVLAHLVHRAPLREEPTVGLPMSPLVDQLSGLKAEAISPSEMSNWIKSRLPSE